MGKKKKRSEEQKRLEKLKERKGFQDKINELGLNYEEVELPPEVVKRDQVARSLIHTIKSMVPYTQEYYEALKAEEEMNDLFKIRVEKARAQELISKSRVGRHEEALEEMMDETNNDFYYFNKLKHHETLTGKYKYVPPSLDPFRFMSRGQNRLRKAVGQQFGLLDDSLLKQLRAHGRELASLGMKLQEEKDEPCIWRGKDPDGNDLHCSGTRCHFLTRKVKNSRNQDVPVYTAQCAYHVVSCIGDHEGEYPPKITSPNSDGLCVECYFHKHKHSPPRITVDQAPGVYDPKKKQPNETLTEKDENQSQVESITATEKGLLDDKNLVDDGIHHHTADSFCSWIPSAEESLTEMRGHICRNHAFYNPETKQYLSTCGMHIKTCIKTHLDGMNIIEIPNIHGLCNVHHIAVHGSVPVPVPFPYPGVEKKLKSKGWLIKPGHWAAPTWPPLKPVISAKKYRIPAKPHSYIERMQELARVLRYLKRKLEFGRLAATAIQAHYRGYRVRYLHKNMRLKNRIPLRARSVLFIQCQMRRFLSTKFVQQRRVLFNKSATKIQSVYHGYIVRKWLKRENAAKVLQRACRMWRDRHFFNTVMMMVQLRKLFQKRIDAAIEIQRIMRGYLSRLHFYRYRQMILLKFHTAARLIQVMFKKRMQYLAEQRRLAKLNDKTKMMRRLAQLIEELYFERKERNQLWMVLQNAAPVMQSLVRGFLGRSKTARMKFLRKALRTWCNPQLATEFMRQILERKVPNFISVPDQFFAMKTAAATRMKKKEVHLSDFIPENVINKSNVDKRAFLFALAKYYEYLRKPMLISEVQSLYRRFRDPVDGRIPMPEISRYINTHKHPCHKHGRTICGDCVYHRECNIRGCICRCFERDDITGKVCKECHHPIALHTILPLDLKPSRKKANRTLLKILNFVSDPDLSLPTSVKGLELVDIGKQVYVQKQKQRRDQHDQKQSPRLGQMKSDLLVSTLKSEVHKTEFIQSISQLEIPGNDISTSKDYWGEKSPTLPFNSTDSRISITVSTFEPNVALKPSEFWSIASKNPNKTVRDYHEKFGHNMPMPIVADDEIIYTIEGSRVYVELLKKLIHLYENDHQSGIHHDNGDFLKLIMNHIQLFERHWRKIVIDIRTGTLNKHVQVSKYSRQLFLSTAFPRPAMAQQLDSTFRELGFHKKVLGKDISIQQYAEKKIPKERQRRKLSVPINSQSLSQLPTLTERLSSPTPLSPGELSPLRSIIKHAISSPLPSLTTPARSLSPLHAHFETTSPSHKLLEPLSFSASATAPTPLTTKKKSKKFNKSEALVLATTIGKKAVNELAQKEAERLSRGATANRNNLVRRGSDTDVVRPVTATEVFEIAHDINTDSRTKYYHLISVDNRFICPFPACGASYSSKETAFQHLKTHEQKRKLHIPTPLSDSQMNYYWPEDNVWKDSSHYQTRSLPPGSIPCTVKGCKEVFASQHRLEYHLKYIHKIQSKYNLLHSFYKYLGRHYIQTPPYPPPESVPVEYCLKHLKLNPSCPTCLSILNNESIPKQPLYFYTKIEVDFNKRDGIRGEVVQFDRNGCEKGVFYYDEQKNIHRGRVKEIVKDSQEDCWLACQELLTIEDAQEFHQHVPFDSDIRHELVPACIRSGLEALAGDIAPPQWVKLVDVSSVFNLYEVTKEAFLLRLRNKELPREYVYYIRPTSSIV